MKPAQFVFLLRLWSKQLDRKPTAPELDRAAQHLFGKPDPKPKQKCLPLEKSL